MPSELVHIILLFFVYSFIGWCSEVVFAAANYGKFVNRGFLNGPVCPIYGMGIILVAYALAPFKDSFVLLFFTSAVLTSALELLIGFVSEKLLKMRLWDYRSQPFNLGGYVCLKFSLLWGLACVFIIRIVHPEFLKLVDKVPSVLALVLDIAFGACFIADCVITMIGALKLPKRLEAITELETAIHSASDRIGMDLAGRVFDMKEKQTEFKEKQAEFREKQSERIEKLAEASPEAAERLAKLRELAERRSAVHRRLINAFPNLSRGKYSDAAKKILKK